MATTPHGSAVYVGLRKVSPHGDSLTVSIPMKELREELGIEPEEIEKKHVRTALFEDGTLQTSLKV